MQQPSRRWWHTAGAWLGIGTAPGALVLGSSAAALADGPVPLVVLLLAGLVMAFLLVIQGHLGLAPPYGSGRRLAEVLPDYLPSATRTVFGWLLAISMVGWTGFNVGLGGAALAQLLGLPAWTGAVLLGGAVLPVALTGRWNLLAVATTVSALLLVLLVVTTADTSTAPITLAPGNLSLLFAATAPFIGYVSVFAVRAPDFTAGLRNRFDLAMCVLLLVLPSLLVATAGALLWRSTGSTDLVAELAHSQVGTILLAVSVIAPTLAAYHSGGLALAGVTRLGMHRALVLIATVGIALAALGFHRYLVSWLVMLAATMPPLAVAMGVEGWRRRRGREARLVPAWSWMPASVLALGLTMVGVPAAVMAGLAAALILAMIRGRRTRVPEASLR
ncbi:hypothetical protein OG394_24375 [Kribbella sp. NBC_01245]|uniref:hypothetical protein n=1 Tax=Kribbella sp. NBC_01245 TaxID=2903578 RepID=UPI002E2B1916|nr:hypothetical protein [Kribbella sp. NBC_01245]